MVVDEELQNPMLKGNLLPINQILKFRVTFIFKSKEFIYFY